jgi:hypothetical protein
MALRSYDIRSRLFDLSADSDALNLKTIRSEQLEATLNALVSGVYLADRRIGRPSIAAEKLLWAMLHQLRGKRP